MKSPFRKFRDLALNKQGSKQKISSDQPEEEESTHRDLLKRFQDLSKTQSKYEGFLTHGQTVSSAAFDFSTSLREMGLYMLETFGDFFDGEIGNAFSMLAKVQIEISKLLDLFIRNVSETIVKPAEKMMTQLQGAQVLKENYDEKWKSFKLSQSEKQKSRLRKGKGNQKSEHVKEEMRRQASLVNSHIQSLFENQSENLLTQLAKFHTAELHLFSRSLVSINAVDPVIKQLAQDREIDTTVQEEIPDDNFEYKVGEELRSDAETNSAPSSPRVSRPPSYSSESLDDFNFEDKRTEGNSKSAPLSPSMYHTKVRNSEDEYMKQENFARFYALPSPTDARSGWAGHQTEVQNKECFGVHGQTVKGYYSGNILEAYKSEQMRKASKVKGEHTFMAKPGYSADDFFTTNHTLKGSSNKNLTEMTDGGDYKSVSDTKVKKYSHSGPFISKHHKNTSYTPANNTSIEHEIKSGPIRSRSPTSSPYNIHVISASPPTMLSPLISELHKLPLPPAGSVTPTTRSPSHRPVQYSAPLQRREPTVSNPASPLPPPPPPPAQSFGLVSRSLSIPSSTSSVLGD